MIDGRLPLPAWLDANFRANQAKKLTHDHWGNPYRYEIFDSGKAYRLTSAGPDGEFGTDDDMIYNGPSGGDVMKIMEAYSRIKKFSFKQLNGKNAALFLLNRKIPALAGGRDRFGKITDLRLDRQERSILFEITRKQEVNTISVQGYRVVNRRGESYLSWESMAFAGPSHADYRRVFRGVEQIPIPQSQITMLETLL